MREPAYRQPALDGTGAGAVETMTIVDDGELVVTRTDRVDYGTADERGFYDYFYAFATYAIRVGAKSFGARRYADTWERVAIFLPEDDPRTEVPHDDAAFSAVARYFFALDDVSEVDVFLGTYVPLRRG